MKTLLSCKVDSLLATATCPQCNSHKTRSFRAAELIDGIVAVPYAPPHPGCRAMVGFYCGATYSIDERDHIVNRTPCALSSAFEADAMNIAADTAFELQAFEAGKEEAA